MDLIDYSLIDHETGRTYVAKVTERERAIYDLDHLKRFRLLNSLKDRDAVGVSTQLDSNQAVYHDKAVVQAASACSMEAASSSEAFQQPIRRAQGKNGGVWKGKTPNILLQCCLPYRKWMRDKPIQEQVWRTLSDDMWNNHQLDYSWEQIKEKIRTLKRQFNQAKQGTAYGGSNWEHYWLMTYILDDPISVPGETTLCPEGFNLLQPKDPHSAPNQTLSVTSTSSSILHDHNSNIVLTEGLTPGLTSLHVQTVSSSEGDLLQHEPGSLNMDKADTSLINLDDHTLVTMIGSPGFSSTVLEANIPCGTLDGLLSDEAAAAVYQTQQKECQVVPSSHKSKSILRGVTASLDSPAKKKNRGAASYLIPARSPLKTTPKRKQPKSALQWESDDTASFVDILVSHKEAVVLAQIPIATWKEISQELDQICIRKTWQVCRDKFHQMNSFFVGTVLPTGGLLGAKKWPYYDKFCKIFEIPEHYHLLVETGNENEFCDGDNARGRLWTKDNVLLLISLYKKKKQLFNSSKSHLRHNILWAQISQEMNSFNVPTVWKQCKDQFATLKKRLHDEYEKSLKTGASPSKWEFFNEMMDVFEGSVTLNAPHSVTAGMGLTCLTLGEMDVETSRSTRTKPTDKSQRQKKQQAKPKKTTYRNIAVEIQEKQLEQREKLIDEVTKIRITNEKCMVERKLLFSDIRNKLDKILPNQSSNNATDDGVAPLSWD